MKNSRCSRISRKDKTSPAADEVKNEYFPDQIYANSTVVNKNGAAVDGHTLPFKSLMQDELYFLGNVVLAAFCMLN